MEVESSLERQLSHTILALYLSNLYVFCFIFLQQGKVRFFIFMKPPRVHFLVLNIWYIKNKSHITLLKILFRIYN